jgi:hypothetical protein
LQLRERRCRVLAESGRGNLIPLDSLVNLGQNDA